LFPNNVNRDQTTGLDSTLPIDSSVNNQSNSFNQTILTEPISLENSNFTTYTYGGYLVQPINLNQFNFSFPDSTNQGEMSGSDALALNTFAIQKMDFDAEFISPKIGALGFDEMAIFASSDTITYKGVEFGIRMDLNDGFIYGYAQEPNGITGDVNFVMQQLISNDGSMHHYSLISNGSGVSFFVDGTNYGYLSFPSNSDYSNLPFFVLAVVHRFADDWDSSGDNMIVGNFSLNQQ
ncbi:MAG TPA: hypothetical protein VLU95_03030, partial [Candidatus Acidoferrum sp.]|nr:hypothetical protein [Candidatus Acidoferrum sp.]